MKREKLTKAAASGAVALIFLVLGFQAAIFTGNVFRYNREHRVDTVYVSYPPGSNSEGQLCESAIQSKALSPRSKVSPKREPGRHRNQPELIPDRHHSGIAKGLAPLKEPDYGDSRRILAEKLQEKPAPEVFEFDPNTVTHDDLVRLGFSEKQARVIENYRNKGGKYNKPRDFARMYVVDSAMYSRLEPYIRITRMDLNAADSLALISLRGIGPYYAHKILDYRRRLGGIFTSKSQLLEIDGLDADRIAGFEDAIELKQTRPRYTLWTATKGELTDNPYIGSYAAKGIIRYRSVTDSAAWSLSGLVENGILKEADAARLKYLDIQP